MDALFAPKTGMFCARSGAMQTSEQENSFHKGADRFARNELGSGSLSPAVLGVVLAGGASKRMGIPKERLNFCGVSLLQLAVKRLGLVCDRVVISRKLRHGDEPVEVIEDLPGLRGPLAGIVSALSAFEGEGILSLPVDTPFVPAGILFEVLRKREGADVVLPEVRGVIHPTIGFYRRSLLGVLQQEAMKGELSPARIVERTRGLRRKAIGEKELLRYGDPEKLLFNVNNPEAYRRALEMAGA